MTNARSADASPLRLLEIRWRLGPTQPAATPLPYSEMLTALAAGPRTIFRDREDVRPEGLRATGSSNARPRWR
jgi:hypothetical protein